MKSRMEKYYDQENAKQSLKRTNRNHDLYSNMNFSDLDEVSIKPNAKVIGNNSHNIDIEKVKEMLDYRYQSAPKRKSIVLEEEKSTPINQEEAKEYDINTILNKALEDKKIDYDTDRLKKLRDTQYNILKNLNLEELEKEELETKNPEDQLKNLINTITSKEEIEKNSTPLDILTDLKGSDNTQVLPSLTKEIENATKYMPISNEKLEEEKIKEVVKEEVSNQIDRSFYTTSNMFTQSDFDDFNDLKSDVKASKTLIKILIILIVIALIIGIVVLLNNILNLGWF